MTKLNVFLIDIIILDQGNAFSKVSDKEARGIIVDEPENCELDDNKADKFIACGITVFTSYEYNLKRRSYRHATGLTSVLLSLNTLINDLTLEGIFTKFVN